MTKARKLRTRYGIVAVLDALGAAEYDERQINKFLQTRSRLNGRVSNFAASISEKFKEVGKPTIFTFADTLVVTLEIPRDTDVALHFAAFVALMRRYLFHSIEKGILFRGAFSIGNYILDSASNTVMGPAVSDAAAWYSESEWVGISSTPKTNTVLELYFVREGVTIGTPSYLVRYDVPLKGERTINLHAISWPGCFFERIPRTKLHRGRTKFLTAFKDLHIPKGAEGKYQNTKNFFDFVEQALSTKNDMDERRRARKAK